MRGTLAGSLAVVISLLAGCGTQPILTPDSHLQSDATRAAAPGAIPQPVRTVPLPPPPEAKPAEVRYSVVVADQNVRDVLLAMARETRINFDIHPGIEGRVTLNAIDQTLKQILTRMTRQVSIRYEVDGQTISVMPDLPYLKTYKVNYVNMSRETSETNSIATQVISGASTGQGGQSSGASGDNNSTLRISSTAKNDFWKTLESNVKDILKEADKRVELGGAERQAPAPAAPTTSPQGPASAGVAAAANQAGAPQPDRGATLSRFYYEPATPVIVSPESGLVTVRANARQHEKVAEFLEFIGASANRQVVIETTIVEVTLNDQYQSGVDWSALAIDGLGYSFTQAFAGAVTNPNPGGSPPFSLAYSNPNAAVGGSLSSNVKLLSQFGTTRVLSSPLLMVLNNQTATLKVVENRVYFNVKADTTDTANVGSRTTFTTTQNVVPIGLIMHITPQISENDEVILSVRPTVTAVIGDVLDPNPALRSINPLNNIENRIPVTRSREMQSVLRVANGRTAILGGLMLDSFQGQRDGLPIVSRIPILGDFFSYRNDRAIRSELVIFVRPVVVKDPSVETDLAAYRRHLPDKEFFRDTLSPVPELEEELGKLERGRNTLEPVPVVPQPPGTKP